MKPDIRNTWLLKPGRKEEKKRTLKSRELYSKMSFPPKQYFISFSTPFSCGHKVFIISILQKGICCREAIKKSEAVANCKDPFRTQHNYSAFKLHWFNTKGMKIISSVTQNYVPKTNIHYLWVYLQSNNSSKRSDNSVLQNTEFTPK